MMTQVNLLAPLITLNNKGCHLVGKGQHDDAMEKFKAALLYLRSSLHSNGEKKTKTTSMMMDSGISLPSLLPLHLKDFHKMLSAYIKGRSGGADTTLLAADTGHYVTFSWALPIVPGYNFSCQTADNEKVLTAVVVFNLALTLHLRALDCRGGGDGGGCSSSPSSGCSCLHHGLLRKAQSLYFHTHQLIVPIVNAYLRHGQASDNVAFDLLVMGLLNNTALVHMELLESADCLGAFQRLIQYVKISSFRWRAATCRRLYPPPDEDAAPPFVAGGGVDQAARSILITTSRHVDNHHHQVLVGQPEPNRSTSSPDEEEEEEFRRIHRMVDQVVNDMIWNATYQKLNVRVMSVAVAA